MHYFVVSDIHSFANALKIGLSKAGFRKTNKEHTLIVVGDLFDRGESVLNTYKYIQSIPKNRRVLIKGNHESLYLKLLEKDYPDSYDFSNCTVDTFCQIAEMQYLKALPDIKVTEYLEQGLSYKFSNYDKIVDEDCQQLWNEIKEKVKNHQITKWLNSNEWKNYYELDKYIFVHSFIPLKDTSDLNRPYLRGHVYSYMQDWRTIATNEDWNSATWGCPWQLFRDGLFDEEIKSGKVLVCGHWHTFDFYNHLKNIYNKEYEGKLYYSKNLIGLDGGVFYNYFASSYNNFIHPQNVLIIDENFDCIDRFGDKLTEVDRNKDF